MTTSPSLIIGIGLLEQAQRVLGFVVAIGLRQTLLGKAKPIGVLRIGRRLVEDHHRHGCAGLQLERLVQLDVLTVKMCSQSDRFHGQ